MFRTFRAGVCLLSLFGGAIASAHGDTAQRPLRPREVILPDDTMRLPASWSLVRTSDNRCEFAVPTSWRLGSDGQLVSSPDGHAVVGIAGLPISSWVVHKMAVKATLHPFTVFEDGADRLWGASEDATRITQHVSVVSGTSLCTADIDVRREWAAALEPTTSRVARSVRIARGVDYAHPSAAPRIR